MKLPQYTEYQFAIQVPQLAFQNDPDLKACHAEETQKGSPRVRSGNYAWTYRLQNGPREWAVRCFSQYDPGQQRYEAIGRFLQAHNSPYFVTTEYRTQGILVGGQWYPITKTAWVRGETLEVFIDGNIKNAAVLGGLLDQFQKLVALLLSWGIAHGDLQHGNVLVSNGKLVLIDYDGMYVPGLAGCTARERGHPDYQHPARNAEFGPELDRFSSIVISLTLKALASAPQLWTRYSAGGDHLILKQKDFISPDASPVLRDMEAIPTLTALVRSFRNICRASLAQVPTLTSFLAGQVSVVPTVRQTPVEQWGQYPVVAAKDRPQMLGLVGQWVTVVGQVNNCYESLTRTGKPFAFLDLGDWQQGDFRLVLWSEAIQTFQSKGKNLQTYTGKWVSVTGLLNGYQQPNGTLRPQIIVSTPSEIEVLTGGQGEARQRLGRGGGSFAQTTTPPPNQEDDEGYPDDWASEAPPPDDEGDSGFEDLMWSGTQPDREAERHFELGFTYHENGQYDLAIGQYEQTVRLDPDHGSAWYNLGLLYRAKGRYDKAVKAFQEAQRVDPVDPDVYVSWASAYERQGRLDLAIQKLEAALRIDADLDSAHYLLGAVYCRMGRLDKAQLELQKALNINASHGGAHYFLGLLYKQQGLMPRAVEELKASFALGVAKAEKVLRAMGKWNDSVDTSPYEEDELPF